MGYHKKFIPKGTLGEISKISEEYYEFEDAVDQGCKILIICELCDMIGAIEAYAKNYNLTLSDLLKIKNLTKSAFEEGKTS